MTLAVSFERAVRAVCPHIQHTAIVTKSDPTSWRIDFTAEATDEQRAAAIAVRDAFDPDMAEVPNVIPLWKARAALQVAGLFDQAAAAISALNNPALSAAWEYGTELHRDSPTIIGLGAALGLTPAQLDALFVQADQISL